MDPARSETAGAALAVLLSGLAENRVLLPQEGLAGILAKMCESQDLGPRLLTLSLWQKGCRSTVSPEIRWLAAGLAISGDHVLYKNNQMVILMQVTTHSWLLCSVF